MRNAANAHVRVPDTADAALQLVTILSFKLLHGARELLL